MFPAELGEIVSLVLIALSAVTSFITASAGIGGGIVLIAIMANVMPAHALIPVHGMVQIGSNAGRALIMLAHVDKRILLPFLLGSVVGAALGGMVAVQLPSGWLQIALACFILYSAWAPAIKAARKSTVVLTGLISSFLTMFVGATGSFVSAMVKTLKLGRMEHVATHSTCMVAQHTIKVISFGLLGFAYGPYLGLIILMIASGFIGTLLGKRLLLKMNDELFHKVLSIILTLLAMRLAYQGITSFT
ncbi:MAG: sulfite exporter TauE/SafE family protein [Hyphomicrobiales bacterium]